MRQYQEIEEYLKINRHPHPKTINDAWESAYNMGDVTLSKLLKKYNIKVKNGGFDINFRYTKKRNSIEVLKNAIEMGLDSNTIVLGGGLKKTLLHIFAESSNKEMVQFLLDHGADTEARCINNYTTLGTCMAGWRSDFSVTKNTDDRISVIDILIKGGANINAMQGKSNVLIFDIAPLNMDIWRKLHKEGAALNYNKEQFFSKEKHSYNAFYRVLGQNVNLGFKETYSYHGGEVANNLTDWIDLATELGVDTHTSIKNDENMFFYFLRSKEYSKNKNITIDEYKNIINCFLKNGFYLVDKCGDNVFHQIFKSPPSEDSFLKLQCLIENEKTNHLLNKENKEGIKPIDILNSFNVDIHQSFDGKIKGFEWVEVKNMYKSLFLPPMDYYQPMKSMMEKHIMKSDISTNNSKDVKIRKM